MGFKDPDSEYKTFSPGQSVVCRLVLWVWGGYDAVFPRGFCSPEPRAGVCCDCGFLRKPAEGAATPLALGLQRPPTVISAFSQALITTSNTSLPFAAWRTGLDS